MASLSRILGLLVFGAVIAAANVHAQEADGKTNYSKKCAMCHGTDGVAKEAWAKQGAKNFNDPAWQKTVTDAQMTKAISDGVPAKKMPSYKDKLKPEEIAALVKHIRSLAPAK
jgi:mono/diheme cytochrome c family protein